MSFFFKLAGNDYDEPRGEITIEQEDGGIRLFAAVYASTENDEIDFECQEASVEHTEGIFLQVQSITEIVGKKFIWESPENEYGYAGTLNVVEYEQLSKAEFVIENISDGVATVYWKGIGDIRWSGDFNTDVPFETRFCAPLPDSDISG